MNKQNLLSIFAGAFIIIIVVGGILYWMSEPAAPRTAVEPPRFLIPSHVSVDGNPVFEHNRIYYRDYSNVLHGLSLIAQLSRRQDMGNEAYRDGRMFAQRKDRAESWLMLVTAIDNYFSEFGRFSNSFERVGNQFFNDNKVDLADYPHGVYAYHMHHRGDWFDDLGTIEAQLYRIPAFYISDPGRYLLSEHYRGGRFFDSAGVINNNSMAYGIGGIHGHIYAWVRFKKPDGADDMGKMDAGRLKHFLGHDDQSLLNISREIALVLDRAWDGPHGIYNFGTGYLWRTDALGSLLRGHKALYDMLWMFGDDSDKEMARKLFDRSVIIYERIEPLIKAWGLPSKIEFDVAKTKPASDIVDLYDWYQFINHIDGGYSWLRYRAGTANFFNQYRPEMKGHIGAMIDRSIFGMKDYHIQQGRLVSTVRYADGAVVDGRTRTSVIGMFLTAVGNHYTHGTAFAPASRWNQSPAEVVENTSALYDIMLSHARELELLLLLNE